MKREDFKKKIVRKDGGFVFQSEWWNIIKNKSDDYKAWFFDVVMAFGIFGRILDDMPNGMKKDMEHVIDALYTEICYGDNPLKYNLSDEELEQLRFEKNSFDDDVREIRNEGSL